MYSDWSSKKHGNFTERVEFVVGKKVGQILVRRPVQNESMSSFLAVMGGKKQDCLSEIRVTQVRMRHQELTRQIWSFATGWAHLRI